jgi:hypothetical protein
VQRCIGAKTDALSFRPQRLALAARQGVNRTELILQNPSSTPDPAAPPPAPPGGSDAAWAQVASDLKAVQQQALATQRAIDQLQAQQEAQAHASGWPVSMVLPAAGGWGVAAVLVLAAALLAWRLRRRSAASAQPIAHDSMTSDLADDPNSMMELQQTVQEQEISQWAPEPVTKEDLASDWGAIPLVRADPVTTFDLEAATGEVTRVRQTLAQRRHERALQRERDARLLREAAERAEDAALAIKLQAVPHRGSWVPDLDLSQDIDAQEPAAPGLAQVKPVGAIEPSTGPLTDPNSESVPAPQPMAPLSPVEIPPMNTYALEADPVAAQSPAPLAVPDNTPVDVYAVKLALAHESEAIELWVEASALAEEALAAPDAALRTQAQATLQRLALKIQLEEQGDDGVSAAAALTPAAAPVGEVPPISEPQPEPQEDVYAVKLALAQESEAVELWDEARELAEEVLASPDPALIAQAQALLTAIAQKLDTMAQDSMPFDDALEANKTAGR